MDLEKRIDNLNKKGLVSAEHNYKQLEDYIDTTGQKMIKELKSPNYSTEEMIRAASAYLSMSEQSNTKKDNYVGKAIILSNKALEIGLEDKKQLPIAHLIQAEAYLKATVIHSMNRLTYQLSKESFKKAENSLKHIAPDKRNQIKLVMECKKAYLHTQRPAGLRDKNEENKLQRCLARFKRLHRLNDKYKPILDQDQLEEVMSTADNVFETGTPEKKEYDNFMKTVYGVG